MGNKKEKEYVPFGEEWEKHMMRMTKKTLVMMYRQACIKNIQLEKAQEKA